MFGTECPSITSQCRKSPPPASTFSHSAPSRAKSADRIEGAISGPDVVKGSVVIRRKFEGKKDEWAGRPRPFILHPSDFSLIFNTPARRSRRRRGSRSVFQPCSPRPAGRVGGL